jgi:hypothetical protein
MPARLLGRLWTLRQSRVMLRDQTKTDTTARHERPEDVDVGFDVHVAERYFTRLERATSCI